MGTQAVRARPQRRALELGLDHAFGDRGGRQGGGRGHGWIEGARVVLQDDQRRLRGGRAQRLEDPLASCERHGDERRLPAVAERASVQRGVLEAPGHRGAAAPGDPRAQRAVLDDVERGLALRRRAPQQAEEKIVRADQDVPHRKRSCHFTPARSERSFLYPGEAWMRRLSRASSRCGDVSAAGARSGRSASSGISPCARTTSRSGRREASASLTSRAVTA